MTDMSTVQQNASAWTSGVAQKGKGKTTNPVLGMQRQAGNQATGGMLAKKKTAAPSVTADDATSAFTRLAPVIDLIAPSAGGSGSFTAQLKIPVKGAFVGIQVGATVSRTNDTSVQLSVTANVTAGATIGVATAKFGLGAYLQVQGRTAREALVIVSWTLYRQLAESNAPREVEQAWFGDSKGKTAEQWDALVRKTLFTTESGNWSEVGAQVLAGAKAGIGGVSASTQAKLRSGRRYDADSIERRAGAKSTTQKIASTLGIDRGAQASLGDRVFSVIATATFSASPLAKGNITITVAVRQIKDKRTDETHYELDKITVTGTASCAGMGTVASALAGAKAMKNLVDKVTTTTATAAAKAKKELQTEARDAGNVIQDVDGMRNGLTLASQQLGGMSLTIPGLTATGRIHVTGTWQDHKPSLKLAFEKMIALTVTAGVFSLTAKRVERLASIEYADGQWTAYLGQLTQQLNKKAPSTTGGGPSSTASSKPGGGSGSGKGTP